MDLTTKTASHMSQTYGYTGNVDFDAVSKYAAIAAQQFGGNYDPHFFDDEPRGSKKGRHQAQSKSAISGSVIDTSRLPAGSTFSCHSVRGTVTGGVHDEISTFGVDSRIIYEGTYRRSATKVPGEGQKKMKAYVLKFIEENVNTPEKWASFTQQLLLKWSTLPAAPPKSA